MDIPVHIPIQFLGLKSPEVREESYYFRLGVLCICIHGFSVLMERMRALNDSVSLVYARVAVFAALRQPTHLIKRKKISGKL